jgi:hypothetical protein
MIIWKWPLAQTIMEGLQYNKSVFVNARQMSYNSNNYGHCLF